LSASPMHQIAAQRTFIPPQCQLIDERREDALTDGLLAGGAFVDGEPFSFCHAQELLHERSDLTGGASLNAQPLTGVEPEPVLLPIAPGQHEYEEIGVAAVAEQLLTGLLHWSRRAAQQQVLGLRQGGDERCLARATVRMAGHQHARVARMYGE